jgi:cytochrome c553
MQRIMSWRLVTLFSLAILALGACGDDDGNDAGPAPDGHTVSKDGVLHMSGLNDPLNNCTGCHGADLRGGDEGQPSCYRCHGVKW